MGDLISWYYRDNANVFKCKYVTKGLGTKRQSTAEDGGDMFYCTQPHKKERERKKKRCIRKAKQI